MSSRFTALVATSIALALPLSASPSFAAGNSFNQLTTGNGFGFQVFDASQGKVVEFLEHPYRYLHAGANLMAAGVERRNLVYDLYFGARVGTTAGWMKDQPQGLVELVNQTNVIRSSGTMGGATVESYYFAPYGYAGNGVVALVKVTNNTSTAQPVSVFLNPNFHLGTATDPDAPGADGEIIATTGTTMSTETGPGGGTMVYLPLGGWDLADCSGTGYARVMAGQDLAGTPTSASGTDLTIEYEKSLGTLAPGASAWWGAAILFAADGDVQSASAAWTSFLAGRAPDKLLADTLAEWDAWRVAPPDGLSASEIQIYRQAEATLRMGQILEPYTETPVQKSYGMIVAALPPGEWDIPWVRDQSYATVALARMGHFAEAKLALNALLDAEAGDYESYVQTQYRISVVRYFGNGHEESDWNSDGPNVELDGWGLYLWAARTYVDSSGDTAWLSSTTRSGQPVYSVLTDGIAAPLGEKSVDSSGMITPDTSIWEAHWNQRKHYAYSTFAAARGLCDFASMAAALNDDATRATYTAISQSLVQAARAQLLDANLVLAASVEQLHGGAYHDAAVLESFNWQLYPATDPLVAATVASLAGPGSVLRVASGGLERNDTNQSSYDSSEWVFVDLRASQALAYAGDSSASLQLPALVATNAAPNYNLLPELYNEVATAGAIGAYAGAVPMVGFGAGAYVLNVLDRFAAAPAHTDCGKAAPIPGMPPVTPAASGCAVVTPGKRTAGTLAGSLMLLAIAILARRRRGHMIAA